MGRPYLAAQGRGWPDRATLGLGYMFFVKKSSKTAVVTCFLIFLKKINKLYRERICFFSPFDNMLGHVVTVYGLQVALNLVLFNFKLVFLPYNLFNFKL